MKKAIILVLTNFFILTLILLGRPAKAQTTEITGQFLYGLELYVLSEKQTNPDYSTAIYSRTIDEDDFITSGLYQNWLQPRLPDNINGYIYLVDSTHTIGNIYLGGGYLEQGQTLSYPYEPSIELKHYNAQLIDIFVLNPVNKYYFESYGGRLDYIVYYEINDGTRPRIKLIDATNNENDYNRVRLTINGYDTGYNVGYSTGYENGQNNGYNSGYEDGQNNGYSAGYNQGQDDFYNDYYQQIYDNGYNAGLGDRQYGVNTFINFNQLTQNPLLEDITPFLWTNSFTRTYQDNGYLKLTPGLSGNSWALVQNTPVISGNIYLFVYDVYKTSSSTNCYILPTDNNGNLGNYAIPTTPGQKTPIFFNVSDTQLNITKRLYAYGDNVEIYIKSCLCFDLTQIYGSGNEPTTYEDFIEDFPSDYYPYTTSTMFGIEYQNGYNTGYDDGYPLGYDDGVSYQATQELTADGWIKNIFTGIGSFLAIQIIPNVSIGLILGIPFIISVAWFVIKMARGGGNE